MFSLWPLPFNDMWEEPGCWMPRNANVSDHAAKAAGISSSSESCPGVAGSDLIFTALPMCLSLHCAEASVIRVSVSWLQVLKLPCICGGWSLRWQLCGHPRSSRIITLKAKPSVDFQFWALLRRSLALQWLYTSRGAQNARTVERSWEAETAEWKLHP